jgi:branched-chain amino acid transport system permease protein
MLAQFTFDGLVIGALYALIGLGIVIIFRTTNVLNFAQGGIATTAAFAAAQLLRAELPYPAAVLGAVGIGVVVGVVVGALLTFVMARSGHLEKSVAALGMFLVLGWANRRVFGDAQRIITRVFAEPLEIGGVIVGGHGLYIIAVSAVAIAGTFWLLQRTRLGLAMRALSQDEETARSYGVNLGVVSLASWGIASGLGALSGVLVGSFIQVDHSIMTIILIQSFAALVLGGFGSATGAVVGGLALGISSSIIAGYLNPAFKNTLVFGIILTVLILRPHGLVGRKAIVVSEGVEAEHRPQLPVPGSWRSGWRLVGTLTAVGAIVLLPFIPHPFSLLSYSVVLATAVIVIALSLFMGYVGEISLGHGALVTIGAYLTAITVSSYADLPFPVAVVASGLLAATVGGALGWVTLRLSGVYLAIATLALSFVVTEVALQWRGVSGGALGLNMPPPHLGGPLRSPLAVYYLVATIFGLVVLAVSMLLRSSVGLRWVAVRDAPVAAQANGVSVKAQKILAFAISSGIAGMGGALLSGVVLHVGPYDYGLFFSIFLILAVILGGSGSLAGALLGAAFIGLMPVALSRTSGLTDAIFGVTLVALLIIAPQGLAGVAAQVRSRLARRGAEGSPPAVPATAGGLADPPLERQTDAVG